MAFSVPASRRELAEINITPLVDVMLVLLVIFIVTAPLLSRPIETILPQPVPGERTEPPNDLVLKVGLGGTYTLDDRPVSLAELRLRLEDALVADPRTVLQVDASAGADYQQLVSALAQAEASGLEHIVMRN
ncbi:biopolymer transporter ExbD [Pseudoxanthomonas sp. PXM03]|uniref:ExbD/TolR family protein n=1 Tax=Pseudoxanthomonas sp. PXM03 TaxID=2769284 RepID=UPI0017838714|nr:biopolymer transporter ExbD [Pseudoxanthomonas sp. PXM03]MBD9437941.1 biopolymer transporter ExbD [Pseudoxanthomonas sp. PXM03]